MMTLTLVPWPSQVTEGGPGFQITAGTGVTAEAAAGEVAVLLREELGLADGDGIHLGIDPSLSPEGYRLTVTADGVTIAGGDAAGVFYGTRTLLQLLPAAAVAGPVAEPDWSLPGVAILDRPRFGWRGGMLDVGRHFRSKEFVLRFIDLLALHKLNVFHWHLTEDQGWRIEIERYPRLTRVGAWRDQTVVGRVTDDHADEQYDGVPHGGFYTQTEIREVVAYAARRFVTVVPEIDLPGHSQAAIAAYPELGNTGQQLAVGTTWGVSEHVLNVGQSTLDFYKGVLDEVLDLFPSRLVHLGGDECPRTEWRASQRAQARIRELGLADEDALQAWFIGRLGDHLASRGRRMIGWDEILEGGADPRAAVMAWRGRQAGIEAARAGHDVVMTPWSHVYLDYAQAEDASEPLSIGGHTPLRKVYEYDPLPAELADCADRVLGAQFNVWTEYMPTAASVEYMTFPRACALAEVVWSIERPPYDDFVARLRGHLQRLDALGVRYRPLDPATSTTSSSSGGPIRP